MSPELDVREEDPLTSAARKPGISYHKRGDERILIDYLSAERILSGDALLTRRTR